MVQKAWQILESAAKFGRFWPKAWPNINIFGSDQLYMKGRPKPHVQSNL